MNPRAFLDTARKVFDSATHEADLRTAIGRAYYALYHTIRIELLKNVRLALIQQAGLGNKNLINHDKLCAALRGCPVTVEIGMKLDHLREARQTADYNLRIVIDREDASDDIQFAEAFFDEIDKFGGAARVVEALKQHLQQIHPGV